MRVADLNRMTLPRLAVVDADASLRTAALSLSRPGIGLVVVCRKDGQVAGVLSKSDLIRDLTRPYSTQSRVTAFMAREVISCHQEDEVSVVWREMASRGLQNVPVLDAAANPVGILDIRDVVKTLLEQEQYQEKLLANYIAGVGYR